MVNVNYIKNFNTTVCNDWFPSTVKFCNETPLEYTSYRDYSGTGVRINKFWKQYMPRFFSVARIIDFNNSCYDRILW